MRGGICREVKVSEQLGLSLRELQDDLLELALTDAPSLVRPRSDDAPAALA
jgi:hypothetical protein